MATSKIEWCTDVWNPIVGCSRVSEGCRNCYAETMARRLARIPQTMGKYCTVAGPCGWTGRMRFHESDLLVPQRWKKSRIVFVGSMGDMFHEGVSLPWIEKIFGLMGYWEWHTFIVLTKRPERMVEIVSDPTWPVLHNVILGTSVESQATADERIPHLLQLAAQGWRTVVVCEPLLGPIDLFAQKPPGVPTWWQGSLNPISKISWVIVGGESGPKARPCNVEWIRGIATQCEAAGVPCFVKQLGSHIVAGGTSIGGWPIHEVSGLWSDCTTDPPRIHVNHPKGADPSEWPEDLRVREVP